jgi:hypothetical protein
MTPRSAAPAAACGIADARAPDLQHYHMALKETFTAFLAPAPSRPFPLPEKFILDASTYCVLL